MIEGYKKTELGWIPVDWDIKQLIEVSIDGINNGVFNDPKKVGSGYKLINVIDMYSGPAIKTEKLSLLNISESEFLKNKVEYGDIFFTRSSLVKEGIAYSNINLSSNDDLTYDGHLMRIRPNLEICYPRYLAYYFHSKPARYSFISKGKTATMTTISQKDIGSVLVPLPPLQEQLKIAKILSTVDEKIDIIDEQIAQTGELKKGLMQRLLIKGIDHTLFKDSPLGRIPVSWEVVRLEDTANINPPKPTHLAGRDKVSFVGMADTSIDARLIYHHEKLFSEVSQGFTSFQDGDVLVAKITPCFENGKGALVTGLINGIGFGSTEFHVLRAKPNILNKFIYYHTINYSFRETGKSNMTGSAGQKRVGKNFITKYQIPLPPLSEQQNIVDILSTVDDKLQVLQDKKQQHQELKKGLMQQLLTGKLRVNHLLQTAVPA